MTFTVIELEYVNPPNVGSIFGVPIGTIDQAIDLMKWAANGGNSEFSCTMIAPLNGTPTIQLEGRTTPTVRSCHRRRPVDRVRQRQADRVRNIDEQALLHLQTERKLVVDGVLVQCDR